MFYWIVGGDIRAIAPITNPHSSGYCGLDLEHIYIRPICTIVMVLATTPSMLSLSSSIIRPCYKRYQR